MHGLAHHGFCGRVAAFRTKLIYVILLALSLSAANAFSATTFTWTGGAGDGLWTSAGNWGGTAPTGNGGETLIFPTGIRTVSNDFNSKVFGTVTFQGTGTTVTGLGFSITSAVNSTGANSIAVQIVLNSDSLISETGGTLTLSTLNTNAHAAFFAVSGGTDTIKVTGDVSGTGQVQKAGSGLLWLAKGAGNSYSGGTTLLSGPANLDSAASFGTGDLSVSGASTVICGAAFTYAHNVTLQLASSPAQLTVDTQGNNVTFSRTIADSATIVTTNGNKTTSRARSAGTATVTTAGPHGLTFGTKVIISGLSSNYNGTFTVTAVEDAQTFSYVSSGVDEPVTADTAGRVYTTTYGLILKDGTDTSTLRLSGTNSYRGGTQLVHGGITVTNNSSIGSGPVGVSSNCNLTGSGGNIVLTNPITDQFTLTVQAAAANSLTLNGIINGGGSIVKDGAGTVGFGAANTYTGSTTLVQGRVELGNTAPFGTGLVTITNNLTIAPVAAAIVLSNAITAASNSVALTVDCSANDIGFSAGIDGPNLSLNKTGANTLTLSATNTYGGDTTLSAGTIALGNSSSLGVGNLVVAGAAGGNLQASATGVTVPNTIQLNQILSLTGSIDFGLAGLISATKSLNLNTAAATTVTISSNMNTYTGGTTLQSGILAAGTDNALSTNGIIVTGPSTLKAGAPTVTLANTVALTAALTVKGLNTLVLNGLVSGGSTLTMNGTGTLQLGNTNGFTGGAILQSGTMALDDNGALGTGTFTINGGTVLAANAAINAGTPVSINGAFTIGGAQPLTFSSTVTTLSANTVIVNNTALTTFSGTVTATGAAALSVGATSTGVLQISGASNNLNLTINGGVVELGSNGAMGGTLFLAGGTLRAASALTNVACTSVLLQGTFTIDGSKDLTLGGAVTLNGSPTLTLTNSGNTTFTGDVGGNPGPFTLSAASTGVLILTGANGTYSKLTQINGGRLRVDGKLPGPINVAAGGTLEGTGTVGILSTGAIVADGTINPSGDGASGTLNIAGDMTFHAGATLNVKLNGTGTSDALSVGGAVSLGNCTLAATQSNSVHADTYNLIQSPAAAVGTFAGLPSDGSALTITGRAFGIFYAAGAGPKSVQLIDDIAPVGLDETYHTSLNSPTAPVVLNVNAANGVLKSATGSAPLTAVLVSKPTHAQPNGALIIFTFNADGSFSYTPTFNFFGTDSFTFQVKDGLNVLSTIHTVTILVDPTFPLINTQPLSQSGITGTTYALSVAAVGAPTLAYQWYVGQSGDKTNPIAGETLPNYQTPTITIPGVFLYWVSVTNTFGEADSVAAAITISPGPVTKFDIQGIPSAYLIGTTKTITVTAEDTFGNAVTAYTGTAHFTCTDAAASIPADYTFLAADKSTRTFPLTLNTAGTQTFTATSTAAPIISGAVTCRVKNAPIIGSTLSVTPLPAIAGVPLQLSTAASSEDPITWTWSFGDGKLFKGVDSAGANSVTHIYTPSGTYTVTVTATDSNGFSTTQSLTINVSGAGVGSLFGTDSDGDGFSDEIENALGTSPTDIHDTPFAGQPAGALQTLKNIKLSIGLNFAKPNSDKLAFSGALTPPTSFDPRGSALTIDIGGAVRVFVLDIKGKGTSGSDSIQVKSAKGLLTLSLKLNKASLAPTYVQWGLTGDRDIQKSSKTIGVTLLLGGVMFQQPISLSYTAKAHRSGNAKH